MKDKNIKKYKRIANKIIKLIPTYKAMSDSDLQNQTILLKERLANGEKAEKLLPQAYAIVAEADRRVLGLEPYYVQILGGIALFYGNVAKNTHCNDADVFKRSNGQGKLFDYLEFLFGLARC
jgi:preprotein translocase subunit SecA